MSRRRPRLFDTVSPRGITIEEAAFYCGLSRGKFEAVLPELENDGFPQIDPITARYDLQAINHWFDRRSGLARSLEDLGAELDEKIAAYGESGSPSLGA